MFEDGKRQTIPVFTPTGEGEGAGPTHLGLMLDTSGSMEQDINLARSAAIKFLNLLPEAEDITLVDFDTEVRVTRYPQRDFARLVERIRMRKVDGWTALYDALGVYLDGADGTSGRSILVMYTDGARLALDDHVRRRDESPEGLADRRCTPWGWSSIRVRIATSCGCGSSRWSKRPAARRSFPRPLKDLDSSYEKVFERDQSAVLTSATCPRTWRWTAPGARSRSRPSGVTCGADPKRLLRGVQDVAARPRATRRRARRITRALSFRTFFTSAPRPLSLFVVIDQTLQSE